MNFYPANEVGVISNTILQFTSAEVGAVSQNGWEALEDFSGYGTNDIETWAQRVAKQAIPVVGIFMPALPGVTLSPIKVCRLCALTHWVNRRILRGVPLPTMDFSAPAMRLAMSDYPIIYMLSEAKESVDKPDPFTYEKWIEWHENMQTYL